MGRILRILLTVVVLSAVVIAGVYVAPLVMAGTSAQAQSGQAGQTSAQAAQGGAAAPGGAQILDEAFVERGDINVSVSATGEVLPIREVALVFETSAPVVEVLVEEGERVTRGDVLARLDTSNLDAAIEDAEVALAAQQAAYAALIADPRQVDIVAAEAAVDAAVVSASAALEGADAQSIEIARLQTELARNQLWQAQVNRDNTLEVGQEFRAGGTGALTQERQIASGLESAEYGIGISEASYTDLVNQGPDLAALGSANAQLVQAQIALENLLAGPDETERRQAEINLESARLAIEQARATLDQSLLRAPFDGVVAQNNLVIGEVPPSTGAAVLMLDDSSFYVELGIDETDISEVRVGQTAFLDIDALGDEDVTGDVSRVAITPTLSSGLVTYSVRVTLAEDDTPVRAGMSATATITVSERNDVLLIPNRLIRIDRTTGNAFVTVERDGQFSEVPVTLGVRNETQSEIVSGLNEGDHVVLIPRDTFNPFGG